jgi:hypothetical protein
MIARIWSGAVRTTDADKFAGSIRETGFAEYGRTPGNAARGCWAPSSIPLESVPLTRSDPGSPATSGARSRTAPNDRPDGR